MEKFKISYKLLDEEDIIVFRKDLVFLMENILTDNITQNYPDDMASQYVDKIRMFLKDGTAIVSGAFGDNQLVGFLWAYDLHVFDEKRLHIDMLGVNSRYRSSGIAKNLLDIQIKEAKKRNINILEAMVTKNNQNSYSWFKSNEFRDERVKVVRELTK